MEKDKEKTSSIPVDDDHMQTVSFQEFTGLIPAGLSYDEDSDIYEELSPYLPPRAYIQGFGDLEK
ncbi:MAG: hypothetical protein IJO48_03870 [Clostridia bacterium]|nr:hypothetical protein [Clostridia bacterium]